jgi:hypothetical protein
MKIDNSRFTAFWSNPEMYRLIYEQNIVPRVDNFYFGRGKHLHELAEARNKATIDAAMGARNYVSDKSKQVAEALFASFRKRWDGDTSIQLLHDAGRPLAEVEFDLPIPGSSHHIVGRMDEIVQYKGAPWVGDTKTANAKATEGKKRVEFGFGSQPIFYVNAARMLGYPVVGMLYRVVTEHVPPKHWLIESKRTEHQLQQGLVAIHQTAEAIEMFRRTFGVEKPWPHLSHSYPCNYLDWQGKPTCEYASICNRPSYELTEDDLRDFTARIDHLDVMKEK